MNRRGFLAGILAVGAAPAIVKAENIMRVSKRLIVPDQSLGKNYARLTDTSLGGYTGKLMIRRTSVMTSSDTNEALKELIESTRNRLNQDAIESFSRISKQLNQETTYCEAAEVLSGGQVVEPYGIDYLLVKPAFEWVEVDLSPAGLASLDPSVMEYVGSLLS